MRLKIKYIAVLLLLSTTMLVGCRRTCVCYGYDELEYRYSEEEVDAHGGNCSNMIMQAGTRYLSYCNWE